MSTATDRPCTELFPEGCEKLNPQQRWNVLRLAVSKIVDQFVDISYPSPATKKDDDRVRAYAKEVLSLGLLLMEFTDAVREGDGERIIRCWKYFLLLFKSSERTNYSVEAFNLLLELEYVMTPRMRQQLTWERTINVHGKSGRNISMDLHMEHINRECKQAMGVLGSNINDSSVARIGKSIGELMKISQQFDKVNDLKEESGRHRRRTVEGDMKKLLTELNAMKVFDHIPGRKHSNFKKMQVNMMRKLSVKSLESWMQQQLQKYQMCYI
jgi:L1 cell adhesion molecule like protein